MNRLIRNKLDQVIEKQTRVKLWIRKVNIEWTKTMVFTLRYN